MVFYVQINDESSNIAIRMQLGFLSETDVKIGCITAPSINPNY